MFSIGYKRNTFLYDKSILEYCMKSTQDSIKRIIEKKNLEKNNINVKEILKIKLEDDDDNNNNNPQLNFNFFLVFLSISSLGFYFYKKLK
jgi:hypothetical protein